VEKSIDVNCLLLFVCWIPRRPAAAFLMASLYVLLPKLIFQAHTRLLLAGLLRESSLAIRNHDHFSFSVK
jgi:hypothetical protein